MCLCVGEGLAEAYVVFAVVGERGGLSNMRLEKLVDRDPENKIVELLNEVHEFVWMSSGLNSDFYNRESQFNRLWREAQAVQE